jgi:hypothetical protein
MTVVTAGHKGRGVRVIRLAVDNLSHDDFSIQLLSHFLFRRPFNLGEIASAIDNADDLNAVFG